jgi:hypothetical protein
VQAQDDDEEWSFTLALSDRFKKRNMVLDVVSIDTEKDDQFREEKDKNRQVLDRLLSEVHHRSQSVRSTAEIRGAFPFKETSTTAYFSGPLTIADIMTIEVKVHTAASLSVEVRTNVVSFPHRREVATSLSSHILMIGQEQFTCSMTVVCPSADGVTLLPEQPST